MRLHNSQSILSLAEGIGRCAALVAPDATKLASLRGQYLKARRVYRNTRDALSGELLERHKTKQMKSAIKGYDRNMAAELNARSHSIEAQHAASDALHARSADPHGKNPATGAAERHAAKTQAAKEEATRAREIAEKNVKRREARSTKVLDAARSKQRTTKAVVGTLVAGTGVAAHQALKKRKEKSQTP